MLMMSMPTPIMMLMFMDMVSMTATRVMLDFVIMMFPHHVTMAVL